MPRGKPTEVRLDSVNGYTVFLDRDHKDTNWFEIEGFPEPTEPAIAVDCSPPVRPPFKAGRG